MAVRQHKSAAGFTLVEVILAAVIFLIAVLGTSAFRYNAAWGIRKADSQVTAARTALLLCESWKGLKGSETFDPITYFGSDLPITDGYGGPAAPTDFTVLGNYVVMLDGIEYYVTLSWKDESPGLRALNVIVAWLQRRQGGYVSEPGYDTDKSFELTAYVAN